MTFFWRKLKMCFVIAVGRGTVIWPPSGNGVKKMITSTVKKSALFERSEFADFRVK
jgi:hypothetical protein